MALQAAHPRPAEGDVMPDLTLLTVQEQVLLNYWRTIYREDSPVIDLLTTIIALRQRVAELEAERRWIPVSEQPPNPDYYLVYRPNYPVRILWWGGAMYEEFASTSIANDATHWQPLPAPPKEDDHAE
jgi:hypothetical protein